MMKKHQRGLVVTAPKCSISAQSSMLGVFSSCDAANRRLHDTCVCVCGFSFATDLQMVDIKVHHR